MTTKAMHAMRNNAVMRNQQRMEETTVQGHQRDGRATTIPMQW